MDGPLAMVVMRLHQRRAARKIAVGVLARIDSTPLDIPDALIQRAEIAGDMHIAACRHGEPWVASASRAI